MSHLYPWSDLCPGPFVGPCQRRGMLGLQQQCRLLGRVATVKLQTGKTKREGCRLIQEEQVGQDQNVKGLECHEKDFRVYCVGHRESNLLNILGWG